ncbi:MAG: DUF424 family protein [Candidatus Bathyarchaeia archaeon]
MDDVYLRVFQDSKHRLVAACDTGLIGETFREGKLKLEVKADFYKGNMTTITHALHEINAADIANLVGGCIVEAAVKEGLVDPSAIVRIAGVPHVQIVRI